MNTYLWTWLPYCETMNSLASKNCFLPAYTIYKTCSSISSDDVPFGSTFLSIRGLVVRRTWKSGWMPQIGQRPRRRVSMGDHRWKMGMQKQGGKHHVPWYFFCGIPGTFSWLVDDLICYLMGFLEIDIFSNCSPSFARRDHFRWASQDELWCSFMGCMKHPGTILAVRK